MVRGICVWNETSTGICGSRLSTYSARPRQSLNVMPSFSAKVWIAPHTLSLMLFRVCFCFHKEGGQLLVIVKLVVELYFMHLLPRGVSLRAKAAGCGLAFCIRDFIPQYS